MSARSLHIHDGSNSLATLNRVALLARTVRHLRWDQTMWRLWYKAYKAPIDARPAPSLRTPLGKWGTPLPRRCSLVGENTFRFLNHVGAVETAPDWNNPTQEKLWLYNLHYFDDLNAEGAGDRVAWHRDLIMRWLADNPPGLGNGWEPYPTSLRIVNWIKWLLAGNRPQARCVDSLSVQVRWVRTRLEYHLLGNHLFANAKALVFAGAFFEGSEADEWARKGMIIVHQELVEQVLDDGGHFERSPMYHLIILEDLLDLINLCRAYGLSVPENWREAATKMLAWSTEMQHPDGDLPFFNDAAIGVAPRPEDASDYARRLGFSSAMRPPEVTAIKLFQPSGYAKLSNSSCTAFYDVGPVGPDYLPAHAHADTLSIEASVHAQRVLVNSGTSVYGTGPERHRQRSTAAHNTIEIDGENSSEVWAGFRVARRARPRDVHVSLESGAVSAWHDGYCRLSGRPCHHRTVSLDDRVLRVQDRVIGAQTHSLIGRFHLHPNVRVQHVDRQEGGTRLTLTQRGDCARPMALIVAGPASVSVEQSSFHPEFGLSMQAECVVFSYHGSLPCEVTTELRW